MRRWLSLLPPIVGLGIFALIVYGIGLEKILAVLRPIDPRRLLVFPLLIVFVLWIRGVRWVYLIRTIGLHYTLWRAILVGAIGYFGGAITPAKVGDAIRAYYMYRDTDQNLGECFVTVVVDRLMDVIVVMVFGVLSVFTFSYFYINLPAIWIIVGAVPVIFGVAYLLLHKELMTKLLKPMIRALAPQRYRSELEQNFDRFYGSIGKYAVEWRRTLVALLLTLVYWASVFALAWTATWVLDMKVSWYYVVLVMPLITLVELIPISVSGLGTRDAAAIYFFAIVGASSAQSVGFALIYVLSGTYFTALIGFFIWLFRPRRYKDQAEAPL